MSANIVGSPARGRDFFDREELVDLLWKRLEAGNSILLAAPRRFGKTSVMYHVIDQPRAGWKPIHVDAESIREPVNFVIALLDALMADHQVRRFLASSWKRACQWTRGLLDGLELTTPWDVGLKIKLKEAIGADWQERGAALLRTLHAFDEGKRLLIIIDELPVMLYLFRDNDVSDAETRAFLYWFRKLRTDPQMGLTNCRFLVGGSIGIESYLSRLGSVDSFNDFERLTLPELSGDRAARFLEVLLESRGLSLSAASRRRTLALVGTPIPYFIQVFVSEVANANAMGTRNIGPKRLEEIYQNRVLGAACKTCFQHYYDRLHHYDKPQEHAAKELLKVLALAHPQPVPREQLRALHRRCLGESATDAGFGQLIGDLENDFYTRYYPESGGYTFASKILCDWWRRYYAF